MEIGIQELLTVPGASAAALTITEFAKLIGLPSSWARRFAVLVAFVALTVTTVVVGDWEPILILPLIVAGATAGLAASQLYDRGGDTFVSLKG